MLSFQQSRPIQPRGVDVPLDYSLRSYVNVLYKVPRMQIFIRNKKASHPAPCLPLHLPLSLRRCNSSDGLAGQVPADHKPPA